MAGVEYHGWVPGEGQFAASSPHDPTGASALRAANDEAGAAMVNGLSSGTGGKRVRFREGKDRHGQPGREGYQTRVSVLDKTGDWVRKKLGIGRTGGYVDVLP